MTYEPVIVVLQGGCIQDVIGVKTYDVFDWDDFNDNPVAYWDDRDSSGSEYWGTIEEQAPELYEEVEAAVQSAIKRREAEVQKDPFWMVPA